MIRVAILLVTENVSVENNLFSGLIGSKTRIKLLIQFFINPDTRLYLRQLAKEFNASTNSIREELNHLTDSKFLKSEKTDVMCFIRRMLNILCFRDSSRW